MAKPQFPMNVRFCPKCGLDKLERDLYRQQPNAKKQINGGSEWLCQLCGFGFKIGKSSRWQNAEAMFKAERSHAPVKFTTASVGEKTANAFLEHLTSEKKRQLGKFPEWLRNKIMGKRR